MSKRLTLRWATAAALGTCALLARSASAQVNVNFNVPGPAPWNSGASWSSGFPPEAQYNEIAVIGSNRSAYVDDAVLTTPAAITIDAGLLEIRSTGSLTAVPGTLTTGNLAVGDAGAGTLTVRRGGSLTVQNVSFGASNSNLLTLGEIGGNGVATFSVAGGAMTKTTQIIGPNVNLSSSGNLDFGGGVLMPVITGATHSTVQVAGVANLGGALRPQFSGHVPAIGNSWNIVTAGQISGGFALDLSQVSAIPRGTAFYVTQSSTIATLRYSNKLVLTVNRATGAAQVTNVVGGPLAFDGYSIASPDARLTGAWNSLQDQIAAWDEADNSSASRLTEFKTAGTMSVNVGGTFNLGTPYVPQTPTALGEQTGENLSFEYSLPGQGAVQGIVEFVGRHNNVVLTIDPVTGGAAIQNESPFFGATIDAYTITSTSGKLLPGAANWNSLDDQNLSTWDEADNVSNFRLTEFNPQGTTALPGGGTVLNLGTPVNIAAGPLTASDFAIELSLTNGQTLDGLVVLGVLPTAGEKPGDFDRDGDADGADFLLWQRTLGSAANPPGAGADGSGNGVIDGADLTVWRNNFGTSTVAAAAASAVAAPEPATFGAALVLAVSLAATRRMRLGCGPANGGP